MKQPILKREPASAKPRLMFYCQHAMGLGHLIRSTEIVRGLHDFDVTFVNAGDVIEGVQLPPSVEVVNLPPLKVAEESHHIQGNGEARARTARSERLLSVWRHVRPEILVIELFPFGRKKFEFELLPLLAEIARTKSRTKVVCSLRDILVSRNDQPQWEEKVCHLANAYFDLILIHSDPQFQRLEETFGRVLDLRCEIKYTGFVVQLPQKAAPDAAESLQLPDDGTPLIVASIGGGIIGSELLCCAIPASELIRRTVRHHLVVITGPRIPDAMWQRVQELAGGRPDVTLLRYTSRFLEYLETADLSISLAGYNTCMNILTTGVPALVYPVMEFNRDEQIIRSHKLEALGAVSVIRPDELVPMVLGRKILSALERRQVRNPPGLETRGVENSAKILMELAHRGGRAESMATIGDALLTGR